MQILNIVGKLLLECERQSRKQARTAFYRNIAVVVSTHEAGTSTITSRPAARREASSNGPDPGRADTGTVAVDCNPRSRGFGISVESNYETLCHRQVVPRLLSIGVTSPCTLRSSRLKKVMRTVSTRTITFNRK